MADRSSRPRRSAIREDVHLDDLPARNRETDHGKQPAVGMARQDPDVAVHENDLAGQAKLRERGGLRHDGLGASNDPRQARHRTAISPQHDIRIEHGHQLLEVAVARGRQERIDDAPLLAEVGVRMRGLVLDAAPRAAGELTRRRGRAIDDGRDVVEGHAEHVVQHEGEALRRLEGLQHHEERESDRVGEHGVGLRIHVGASDDRIGHVHVIVIEGILPARGPRSQHIQAHARDDGRQPGAQVFDGADIGPAQSNPAFLDRVLGFGRGPEHPVRHRAQMSAVLFKLPGEPFRCGHRSHSSVAFRHGSDG